MLGRRILFALILVIPIIAVIVFAPHPYSSVLAVALYLVAAWEWSGFMQGTQGRPRPSVGSRLLVMGLYAALMGVAAWATSYPEAIQLIFMGSLIWWFGALVWITRFPTRISNPVVIVCGIFVIIPAITAILQSRLQADTPAVNLIFVLLLVWAADVGAYFVGRAFGQRKLAPKVSPGKTWEGLLGGMTAALLVALAVGMRTGIPVWKILLLSLLVVAGSVVGDLTVSMFKRNAGVKDAGVIFPGHGGVLDRFDSFSAAAPILFALMPVFGMQITGFF